MFWILHHLHIMMAIMIAGVITVPYLVFFLGLTVVGGIQQTLISIYKGYIVPYPRWIEQLDDIIGRHIQFFLFWGT